MKLTNSRNSGSFRSRLTKSMTFFCSFVRLGFGSISSCLLTVEGALLESSHFFWFGDLFLNSFPQAQIGF